MEVQQNVFRALLYVSIFAIVTYSCDGGRGGMKPSTGKTNEMLVITNSDSDWNGRIGKKIQEYFGQELPGLPQSESMFSMAHVPDGNFSKMFQTHHNIFIVDVNPEFKEPLLETKVDLWSSPQRVVKMTVPDRAAFFEEFDLNKEAFISFFDANERRRAANAYGTIEDYKITGKLLEDYNIDILIPQSFYIATAQKDFVWLRREAERFSQGIIIYSFPYVDTMAFNYNRIITQRDSLTKLYVPGPSDGSYMKISMIEPPVEKRIDFNGLFAVEMRGLWELEGDFMGGPFVSYTLVDEARNRVVTVDGYVYNPSQDKKDLVRQIEALLYTLKFGETDTQSPK